jgi:hypothetical protein
MEQESEEKLAEEFNMAAANSVERAALERADGGSDLEDKEKPQAMKQQRRAQLEGKRTSHAAAIEKAESEILLWKAQ